MLPRSLGQRRQLRLRGSRPLAKVLEIPVELKVTGEPQIATDKKSLDFGELWVGKQKELALSIANPGTDILKVSSLILGNKEMSVSPSTLSVEPGEKEVVTVRANPKTKATISTNLTITSNAKNAAQLRIPVSLKAILPPDLRFAPENLLVHARRPREDAGLDRVHDQPLRELGVPIFHLVRQEYARSVDRFLVRYHAQVQARGCFLEEQVVQLVLGHVRVEAQLQLLGFFIINI